MREIAAAAEQGREQLLRSHQVLSDAGLGDILAERFGKWEKETERNLENIFPFREEQRAYENAMHDTLSDTVDAQSLLKDISNFKDLDGYLRESWTVEIPGAGQERLREIREEFLGMWGESLERRSADWYLQAIETRRTELIITLEQWLRFIEAAMKASRSAGIEPGILWDLSENEFTANDIGGLQSWAEEFRKDPALRRLCEMLGRSVSASAAESVETISVSVSYKTVDTTLSEELSGVETGSRIEDLLPSEKGLLNDPDLEILFDLKYAENRLMCFDKQGYSEVTRDSDDIVTVSSEESFMGPIILCIDTSGSMQGSPERIAKAVALYMAMTASAQRRRCYLINFSTSIRSLDIEPPAGMRGLLDFLSHSFHGGTDIVPALREAVKKIGDEDYSRADVLVVSDFVMPPDAIRPLAGDMERARRDRCRFHSLTIGSFPFGPDTAEYFDGCWTYSPADGRIV